MTLICPSCGAEIPPERVNAAQDAAHCTRCNEIFSLKALISSPPQLPTAKPRPPGGKIESSRDRDTLTFIFPRKGTAQGGCLLIFAVIWNVFTVSFLTSLPLNSYLVVFMALFMLMPVIIGIGVTLAALYCWFGRTSLRLTRENVTLERRMFGRAMKEIWPTPALAGVRRRIAYYENYQPVFGVGVEFDAERPRPRLLRFLVGKPRGFNRDPREIPPNRGFVVAAKSSADEQSWFVNELRCYLHDIGHPAWKACIEE